MEDMFHSFRPLRGLPLKYNAFGGPRNEAEGKKMDVLMPKTPGYGADRFSNRNGYNLFRNSSVFLCGSL